MLAPRQHLKLPRPSSHIHATLAKLRESFSQHIQINTIIKPSSSRTASSAMSALRSSTNLTRPLGRRKLPSLTQRRHISAYGYEQAKALVYTTHGEPSSVLQLHAHSISPAHSSLATVRFLASPINPADINTIQGVYPTKPALTTTAASTATPAAVPGNEGVAEVLSAGSGAQAAPHNLRRGDWVIMKTPHFGTWRTHAQADATNFSRLTDEEREGITPVQAGTVGVNPCTAWAMLKGYIGQGQGAEGRARGVREGEWVIQNGANSGVGRAVIQLAKEWGVKSINVVRARPGGEDATQRLKEELMGLGADHVVTEEEATDKGFPERVKEWTNGGREALPLALNCVAGRSALNLAKVVDLGGYHVTYGAMAKQPLTVPAGMLIFRDLRFTGFWVSRWGDANPDLKRSAVVEVLKLTRLKKFKDVPVNEIKWEWKTEQDTLVKEVQGTLEGYRSGKGVFVFGET